MRTELVHDLSFADYCAAPGINQSAIKLFDYESGGCPALFKYAADHGGDPRPDTAALRSGRAYHHFLLQPDTFEKAYAVCTPEVEQQLLEDAWVSQPKGKKSEKFSVRLGSFARWKQVQEANGLEVVSHWEVKVFEEMAAAIRSSPDVAEELRVTDQHGFEVSAFAAHKIPQLQLKARFDLVPAGDALIDLKSARSAHPTEFAKAVANNGLDIQAAVYLDVARLNGLDKRRFGFLTQDKFPPYLAAIHWLPNDWIRYGRIRYRKILFDLGDCMKRNQWDGYRSGELTPPSWILQEIEALAA